MSDEVADPEGTTEQEPEQSEADADAGAEEQRDSDVEHGSQTDEQPASDSENGSASGDDGPDTTAEAQNRVEESTESEATPEGDAQADDGSEGESEPEYESELARQAAEYDAELAGAVEELATDLHETQDELADLEDRLKRNQADFQNYKKRAKKRQDRLEEQAAEDFVTEIIDVRDNLVRALQQEEGTDIRPGVESTLEEFDRILQSEGFDIIEPEPGTEVDPTRHQVMMRVDSDLPDGTIAELYKEGLETAETVLREAQVTVSEGSEDS
jgi:molecular chaperone GrpE